MMVAISYARSVQAAGAHRRIIPATRQRGIRRSEEIDPLSGDTTGVAKSLVSAGLIEQQQRGRTDELPEKASSVGWSLLISIAFVTPAHFVAAHGLPVSLHA